MLFRRFRKKTRLAGELEARMTQEAERGRRLAIYDQRTGLLARWYFELRLLEETHRCKRYGLPMAVLTLRTSTKTGEESAEQTSVVARSLRSTDLAADLGVGQFAICLLHNDRTAAALVLRRLMRELDDNDCQVGMAVYPDDECEGKALVELALSAVLRLGALVSRLKFPGQRRARPSVFSSGAPHAGQASLTIPVADPRPVT